MSSLGIQLCRAAFLASILLLLRVKGVIPLKEEAASGEEVETDNVLSTYQDQEQFEEHFLASSVGELWQVVDMAQQENEDMSQTVRVRSHLFDLAFCFNLASILVFL